MKKLIIVFLFLIYVQPLYSSWELILPFSEMQVNAIETQGNTVWIGTRNNGIYKSTDNGETWKISGLEDEWIIYIESTYNAVFVGTATGLFYSDDGGDSWVRISINDKVFGILNILIHNDVIALITYDSTNNNSIYISEDSGATWFERNAGISSFRHICMAIKDDILYVGTWGEGIYHTTNFGVNWEPIGFQDFKLSYNNIYAIMEYENILYISVFSIKPYKKITEYSIYKSSDDGINWEKTTAYFPPSYMLVYKDIFLGFMENHGLNHSTDFGDKWQSRSENLTGQAQMGKIFVVNEYYDSIFLFTYDGLFRTSLDYVTSVQDQVIKTDEYEIFIYPQPASTQLTIEFDSSMDLNTKISLNDLSGKEVLSVNYDYFVGNKSIFNIDTSSLISGSYFLIFQIGENVHSKTISIIK